MRQAHDVNSQLACQLLRVAIIQIAAGLPMASSGKCALRPGGREQTEVGDALMVAATAQTLAQLRQCQAILIPALTGASLEVTARLLGVSRNHVCMLRRLFRSGGTADAISTRGGRRRALMSIEEEAAFLAACRTSAHPAREPDVAFIHAAFERAVGRQVPKSTVYRLLARHGWQRRAAAGVAL